MRASLITYVTRRGNGVSAYDDPLIGPSYICLLYLFMDHKYPRYCVISICAIASAGLYYLVITGGWNTVDPSHNDERSFPKERWRITTSEVYTYPLDRKSRKQPHTHIHKTLTPSPSHPNPTPTPPSPHNTTPRFLPANPPFQFPNSPQTLSACPKPHLPTDLVSLRLSLTGIACTSTYTKNIQDMFTPAYPDYSSE
jgi:hypothetical protein